MKQKLFRYFAYTNLSILIVLILSCFTLSNIDLYSQTVKGTVLDRMSGEPVDEVEITVTDSSNNPGISQVSDKNGRFTIRDTKSGVFFIRTYKYGCLNLKRGPYNLSEDDTLNLSLTIDALPGTMRLIKISRAGKIPYLERVHFYERKREGKGYYITNDEIRDKGYSDVYELLRTVPGLIVNNGTIFFSRYLRGSPSTSLQPTIYVDNALISTNAQTGNSISWININDVIGVEVYSSIDSPPRYFTGRSGGVILIWLREN